MKKELKCPHCGADLLAKQNTITRETIEVQSFSIGQYGEEDCLQLNSSYCDRVSSFFCMECDNNINHIVKDFKIKDNMNKSNKNGGAIIG